MLKTMVHLMLLQFKLHKLEQHHIYCRIKNTTLDGVTATTFEELNYVDVTTLGTVQASKAVTADSNGDVLFP